MAKADRAVLEYWQSSVSDSAIGDSCLTSRMLEGYHHLTEHEASSGVLGAAAVRLLFNGMPDDARRVAVTYRPLHVTRQTRHGRQRRDGLPVEVTPIVSRAEVDRDGLIVPSHCVIGRDILDPLARGAFSIGRVGDLDRFMTVNPFPSKEQGPGLWDDFREYWRWMLAEVGCNWPSGDREYSVVGYGLVRPAAEVGATVKQILDLTDALLRDEPETPLLANFARTAFRATEKTLPSPYPMAHRLGHSGDRFAVANHQREVLAHLVTMRDGDILAVNGPPGTGKTTVLLSAIASEWVRAALKRADPPLIVAASTNNQAVTNIIDAFGKDFEKGEGPFAGRWLPGISSFGLFLSASSKEADASVRYQTERFFLKCETPDYVREAKHAYIAAGETAFPAVTGGTVTAIVEALHKRLVEQSEFLLEADRAHARMREAEDVATRLLGEEPTSALHRQALDLERLEVESSTAEELSQKWESWQTDEPLLWSLFSFLPPVARRRALKARNFLRQAGAPDTITASDQIEIIDSRVRDYLRVVTERSRRAQAAFDAATEIYAESLVREREWNTLAGKLLPNSEGVVDREELDRAADRLVRFPLFLLATHYWEGRWLLAMEQALPSLERVRRDGRGGTDRKLVAPMWARRMMLTPCAVSTFATLPRKMTCRDNATGSYRTEYLFNHIDLLIVDEAGQVLPEIAGPSFALGKKALVIGDTQQIEPISALSPSVDTGNLIEAGLLPVGGNPAVSKLLEDVGLTSRNGSTMRLAQAACRFHPYPELERGLYLFEHRRCFDEIIGFCNELSYKGALRPMRGSAPRGAPHPIGYLHIEGIALSTSGSRYNPLEAKTIAAWLAANAASLKSRYGKRLEDIVGIVTPFGRQVREIRNACGAVGIDVGREGMTVGTVHALQGAERNVVIFSPVYSKHADGSFMDLSPSMLNVAVSRAKELFLVFGDMDTLASAMPGSPRSLLSDYLSRDDASEIVFDVPSREDLSRADRPLEALRDADEHDAFLLREFTRARNRLCIVSPWVNVATMAKAGITASIEAAIERNVTIDVYSDPLLTRARGRDGQDAFAEASDALAGRGATLHPVRQLHSKLVWIDDRLLAVGSYNWLSAHRSGEFARHETTVVYRGPHLAREIEVLQASLKARVPEKLGRRSADHP